MNLLRNLVIVAVLALYGISVQAQVYEALSYNFNGTPSQGVKIKTNLPFTNGSQMMTLNIEGYSYGVSANIGLSLSYYIYGGGFVHPNISSYGAYAPDVYLSSEGGKVVIFIDDKVYYQRFHVRAFAQGMQETASWFDGWTVVDQAVSGSPTVKLAYKTKMPGQLLAGDIIASGNVGIGTNTPAEKLSVNGNIRAKEIKVEAANWPDYVFEKDYQMPSLTETEAFINEHKHLPGMPNKDQVAAEGISLGEMNRKLLEKVEELTLLLIEKEKEISLLKIQMTKFSREMRQIKSKIK